MSTNEQKYRTLDPNEVIQEGDEGRRRRRHGWVQCGEASIGTTPNKWPNHEFRRPIPAETEPKGEERIKNCPQCGAATVQPRDSETYCEECGWPDENRGDIIGQWQEAIRMKVIALSGCPDHIIDGAGCDSGDPLDFTLTEIALGFNYLNDQIFELRAQLADAESERDRLQAELAKCREALRPFAKIAHELEPDLWADGQILFAQGSGVTVGHCRQAKAALEGGK